VLCVPRVPKTFSSQRIVRTIESKPRWLDLLGRADAFSGARFVRGAMMKFLWTEWRCKESGRAEVSVKRPIFTDSNKMLRNSILLGVLLGLVSVFAIAACSSSEDNAVPHESAATDVVTAAEEQEGGCQSTGRLHELWEQRTHEDQAGDYPVGAGDVLRITMADLPEVKNLDSRVSGQGTIDLPLIGEVHVAGLTDSEVEQELTSRARKYQKSPRVHVFVRQFSSRNVQVMGMVAQPGTYPLTASTESVLSVLGRAGGTKGVAGERAAERVVLFPARSNAADVESGRKLALAEECFSADGAAASDWSPQKRAVCGAKQSTLELSKVSTKAARPGSLGASVIPIIIDLKKPSMTGCLDLPARPGDIVLVPAAGQVGVYGWVAKPGSFDVTSGMTVLSALTSAGGATFSSDADLLRTSQGNRVSIPVDLSEVEKGKQPDPAVQAGDIILVKRSVVGAVPYGVYTLFSKFSTGLYLAPAMGL
jgi:protein involved in polysaccharide export with SLBB domain